MKKALLLLLLFLPIAAAREFSACFPYPSALGLGAQGAAYQGAYGNYTVHLQPEQGALVRVEGPDASLPALIGEIGLLQERKILEVRCNLSQMEGYGYSDYACFASGEWQDAGLQGACVPAGDGALPYAAGVSKARQPPPEQPPVPALPKQGAETAAEPLAQQEGGTLQPSGGISPEQLAMLVGAVLAVILLSYLLLHERQLQLEVSVEEQRLLGNKTRAAIMEELSRAERIPTDLSSRLGKSKATVVEHLGALADAGFVERLATPGRKFVYYRLTQKGRVAMLRRSG